MPASAQSPSRTVVVHSRIPVELVDEIDEVAATTRHSRSFVLRDVIEAGWAAIRAEEPARA